FIGEPFNPGDATVVLTNDDGSTRSTKLNSEEVTLSGYDSTVVGTQTIHLSYRGYEDTFEVNVYEPDGGKPTLQKPGTRLYGSHINQLDLGGGSWIFRHGDIVKYVTLTQDMVKDSKHDFSKATIGKNRAEYNDDGTIKSVQTEKTNVTVTYGGYIETYEVEVYFSEVSVIKYYANTYLSSINWGGAYEDIIHTPEQDAYAVEAARIYFNKLSDEDKAYITESERDCVMLTAAYTSYENWINCIFDDFKGVLSLMYGQTTGAYLDIACDDPEMARASLEYIKENGEQLNQWNRLLWHILGDEELNQLVVYVDVIETTGEKIDVTLARGMYLAIDQEIVDGLFAQLKYVIELYDALDGINLSNIPKGQAPSQAVIDKLADLLNKISSSNYYDPRVRSLYRLVESWRSDYFDIIYKFLWERTQDGYVFEAFEGVDKSDEKAYAAKVEEEVNAAWLTIVSLGYYTYFPATLEELYNSVNTTLTQALNDSQQSNAFDASNFYYSYFNMLEIKEKIANMTAENSGKDARIVEMYKDFVENCGYIFDYMTQGSNENVVPIPMSAAFERADQALIYQYNYAMEGIEEFHELLQTYVAILMNYNKGNYTDRKVEQDEDGEEKVSYVWNDKFREDISSFLHSFIEDYDVNIQYNFIFTVLPADTLMMDIETQSFSTFTSLLQAYFSNVLDDKTIKVAANLLRAYECFLRRNNSNNYNLTEFFNYVENSFDPYLGLTTEQQEPIKFIYNKVKYFNDLYLRGTFKEPNIGNEWKERFERVAEQIGELYRLSLVVFYQGVYTVCAPYLAAYENVIAEYDALRADIKAVTDADLRAELEKALYYGSYDLWAKYKNPGDAYGWLANLDAVYYSVRYYYMYILLDMAVSYWGQEISLYETAYNPDGSVLHNSVYDTIKDIVRDSYKFFVPFLDTMYDTSSTDSEMYIDFSSYLEADPDYASYFEGIVNKFLDYSDNGWDIDQKMLWMSIQLAGTDAFYGSVVYYYSEKIGEDASVSNKENNIVNKFMALAYNYLNVANGDKYLESNDLNLLTSREDYRKALQGFQEAYGKLADPEIKAAFDKIFGEYVKLYSVEPDSKGTLNSQDQE
ncbi:MAG: bacterial Ig-like domain-containing protein, partial [Clostridiales bacterium]|nr:bacterial Ig-like domain-containing protein [Clostridiales bacterium]